MKHATDHAVLPALLTLLLTATMSTAQTVYPANWTSVTSGIPSQSDLRLLLQTSPPPTGNYDYVLASCTHAGQNNIPPNGLQGNVLVLNPNASLNLTSDQVAFLECDPTSSFIQPNTLLSDAVAKDPVAIVLWSSTSDYCALGNGSSYDFPLIFTMTSSTAAHNMLKAIEELSTANTQSAGAASGIVQAAVMNNSTTSNLGNSTAGNGTSSGNQGPPVPGTAVAMIILYAVTGVITALFLAVIVTGAVRAHRHPERYGPRNTAGRPRQSRARGLARAMLESLPIVKFGDPEEPKPNDIEMASGQHGPVELLPAQEESSTTSDQATHAASTDDSTATAAAGNVAKPRDTENDSASTDPTEGDTDAITAAAPIVSTDEHQGCSICTDDFQIGEDQRVLPCNHRFHPACVDPWLLNVSGTCPLCRIDLRGAADRPSSSPEDAADADDTVPPLNGPGSIPRSSFRRSLLIGLAGATGLDRMSRDERVRALREMRNQQVVESSSARRNSLGRVATSSTAGSSPPPEQDRTATEEESRVRARLRKVFRVRTRRTGGEESQIRGIDEREEAEDMGEGNTIVSGEGTTAATHGTDTAQESARESESPRP